MKTLYRLGLSILLVSCLGGAAYGTPAMESGAIRYAQSFLEQLEKGRCDQAWRDAPPLFKLQTTEERWNLLCRELRPLFGSFIEKSIKTTRFRTSLPGAPDGDYYIIVFSSRFENKKRAIETVTLQLGPDGSWDVVGYVLR